MKNDWALATIAYPLSRFLFPLVSFGRVQVAPWESRTDAPWRIRRIERTRVELGPDLAGLAVCALLALEAFSLANAFTMLQRLPS
jgi:hypothetical protein